MPTEIKNGAREEGTTLEEHQITDRAGGIKRINKHAVEAQRIIPKLRDALARDYSLIDFNEFEEGKGKKRSDKIIKVVHYAACGIAIAGLIITGMAERMNNVVTNTALYYAGLGTSLLGVLTILGAAIAKEKIEEHFKPGIKRVNDIMHNMSSGIIELGNAIKELITVTSPQEEHRRP